MLGMNVLPRCVWLRVNFAYHGRREAFMHSPWHGKAAENKHSPPPWIENCKPSFCVKKELD
jgi:hypothetical protein